MKQKLLKIHKWRGGLEAQERNLLLECFDNMIQPLLNNLQKNPEKDYIYWPNRLEKVEAFGDSLTAVYKG